MHILFSTKNRDGRLTRSEAKAAGILISPIDLNNDGRVTRSELAAYNKAFGIKNKKSK